MLHQLNVKIAGSFCRCLKIIVTPAILTAAGHVNEKNLPENCALHRSVNFHSISGDQRHQFQEQIYFANQSAIAHETNKDRIPR